MTVPDITNAERIVWQRQACALLASLLTVAAKDSLPAIAWTVTDVGASLHGEFLSRPHSLRREHFAAWKAAITAVSGCRPEIDREHEFSSGEARLAVSWPHLPVKLGAPADQLYPSATVTLTASIWPDEENENG